MIASLPMYARATNRDAHNALWALIRDGLRDRGIAAPDALDHETDHVVGWGRDDLVLGHICNLPLRVKFNDHVTKIGASDYGLAGCPRGHYCSVFVVRANSPATCPTQMATKRFAFNEPMSQSGYGAAQLWAKDRGFQFTPALQTGSHRASIDAVASGNADIAAIDAQTWRIEQGENPQISALKVIGHTATSPGMTFITRKGQNPAPYFAAISDAISRLPAEHAAVLGLKAIVALPQSDYELPFPPVPASISA